MKTTKELISEAVKIYFKENTNYIPGDKTKTIENDKLVDIVIDKYDNNNVYYTRNDGTKGSQPIDMFEDTSTYIKKRKKDDFAPPPPETINPDEIMQVSEDGESVTTSSAIAIPELPIALIKRKYDTRLKDGTYVYNTNEKEFSKYNGMHSKGKKWNEFIDENSELGQGVKYYSRFGNVAFRNPVSKGIVYIHKR